MRERESMAISILSGRPEDASALALARRESVRDYLLDPPQTVTDSRSGSLHRVSALQVRIIGGDRRDHGRTLRETPGAPVVSLRAVGVPLLSTGQPRPGVVEASVSGIPPVQRLAGDSLALRTACVDALDAALVEEFGSTRAGLGQVDVVGSGPLVALLAALLRTAGQA